MPIASAHLIMLHAPDVDAYVVARRRTHAAGGTIRRELGMLTKMLRLAYQNAGVSERVGA